MWGCGGVAFRMNVGGWKGVVALGFAGSRAGDGDNGSGFGLKKTMALWHGVCSDWVCRGGAGG